MLTTYDLASVERFAANFQSRLEGCEGGFCEDLDNTLRCTRELCRELRTEINQWAEAVFTGRLAHDPAVEAVLLDELRRTLSKAESLSQLGEESRYDCLPLKWLDRLKAQVKDLRFLADNWVSPCRSVGPGPRVDIGDAARAEIADRAKALPPLPPEWQPADPRWRPFFPRETK